MAEPREIGGEAPHFIAVDFYCGAGGTTRGLIDAGGYVVAGIDKDPRCKTTYEINNKNLTLDHAWPKYLEYDMFPSSDIYPEGQREDAITRVEGLLPRVRRLAPEAPLLFAICAPCQSFTKFVQRHLQEDRENERERDETLLQQTLPFIERFQPEMILSENVPGARQGKFKENWRSFWNELRDLGYAIGERTVSSERFGVAQKRRRLIAVAVKSDRNEVMRLDKRIPREDAAAPAQTVMERIGDLPHLQAGEADEEFHVNHRCRNLSDLNKTRLLATEPGGNNRELNEEIALPCHQRLDEAGDNGFKDSYTRMQADHPSPTITTRFISISNGRFGHYDPEQPRGLSILEGALLQSFEREYKFPTNSMDAAARMIGNAVPPKLASFMSKTATEIWREHGAKAAD